MEIDVAKRELLFLPTSRLIMRAYSPVAIKARARFHVYGWMSGSMYTGGIDRGGWNRKKKLEKRKVFILRCSMPLETLAIIETTLLQTRWARDGEKFLFGWGKETNALTRRQGSPTNSFFAASRFFSISLKFNLNAFSISRMHSNFLYGVSLR